MKKAKKYTICVIGGDGIGPEVTEAALRLLEATMLPVQFTFAEAGYGAFQKHDTPLPQVTLDQCKESDAILFGAVTTPPGIKDYFSPIVRLRKLLNLYANQRPFYSLPLAESLPDINMTIVRENTEDLYSGQERLTEYGAEAVRVITRDACLKIVRFAFELAQREGRKKVTAVHKANVLRLTDGVFLEAVAEVAQDFPEITLEEMLVDSCALRLVKQAKDFEILVTTNMFGDILSDEAAALVGGLGVAASANVGEHHALFEPVHGSAPDIAGTGRANPTAAFLATAMLLEYLGEWELSGRVKEAVITTLKNGALTRDVGGTLSTEQFTEKVLENFTTL